MYNKYMKCKLCYYLVLLNVVFTHNIFSQGDQDIIESSKNLAQEVIPLDVNYTIPKGFYAFKLENGLEVYVQEDFTIPTTRVEYISKAGSGRQTQDNTGFYQLYSRLFWKNNFSSQESYNDIGAGEFTAQSGFSQSRYSFIVPSSQFPKSMELFSNDLKNNRFSDDDIRNEYNQLKNEVTTWASSLPGFINASVDARVFAHNAWTKDSGIYPSLFSNQTIEEVRYKLSVISKEWYVPDQSALFINGPLSAQTVLKFVKEYFSSWQSSYLIGNSSSAQRTQAGALAYTNEADNTFVLVSNDFSKDYIQAVIQYTSAGLGASNEYSATSWTAAQMMETKLQQAGMTNTNTSFIADASDSRIIIQTLLDTQSLQDDIDIALMLPGFTNIVKSSASSFTQNELAIAKNRAVLLQNNAATGSESFMDAVAANWAYGGVDYFFNWTQAVYDVSLEDTKKAFDQPRIFVLLHSDLFNKNKERFERFNYSEITRDNGAWYSSLLEGEQNNHVPSPILPSQAIEEYSQYTKSLISTFSTSVKIPITTQAIPETPWVSLLLNIDGGEVLHGYTNRGLEDLSIGFLKKELESAFITLYSSGGIKSLPEIESTSGVYSSTIGLVFLVDDLEYVLSAVSSVIKNIDISIASADELYLSTTYNWRIESGSLEYQLYAAAMETIFAGSEVDGLYDANTEYFTNTDYNRIRLATQLIYDPNRISFVVSGSIPANIGDIFEKYFGKETFYPVELAQRSTLIDEQEPIFSPLEQIVRLRHTFLTDVPADLAGERPAKLIPTTDFSDPAQLYFKFPVYEEENQSLFIALLYEVTDRLAINFSQMRNPPAQTVTIIPGTGKYPVSSLRFGKVKSRSELKTLVERTFNDVLTDIREEQKSEQSQELITKIKSRYTRVLSREMVRISDRSYLILQGITATNNPSLYLDRFEIVEKGSSGDFLKVFEQFLQNGEFYWVFSADTNR